MQYQAAATGYYTQAPEYFTDYSAPPQPIGDVNAPYRTDEPMYERNYDEEQRQFHIHLPQQPQGMTGVSLPVEYVHERYEVQRGYIYPHQEYMNPTDPHTHAYGGAPNMYRPPTNFQYQPYFMPPQQGSGMAPHSINLQPMQQQPSNVHMNVPNYVNTPSSNVNYSAPSNTNQGNNENLPQDYEDE